ncbi:MAG: DUF6441 family protein [Paracoccaceae bacterium]|nr:DUF6441 family protein [Paracoccaceae bacterium]
MKLFAIIEVDIRAMMKAELEAAERAVTAGVAEAASGLQTAWRGPITGAALGASLANSVRKKLYPTTGASIRAAAVVYSNASKVVDAFDRGVLIRSKNGFWLAIPTAAAGKKGVGNKRITPGGWEQRTGQRLRFVFRRGQPSLLVAETRLNSKGRAVVSRSKTGRGLATVPIFILVPQVKLPKRLSLEGPAREAEAKLTGLILAHWDDGCV